MPTVRAVPGYYTTIQAAHDAAEDGDTILIEPGEYKAIHFTKHVHVKGNTDDPINNPVCIGGCTPNSTAYRSYVQISGCDADRWFEGVTFVADGNARGVVEFRNAFGSEEHIYFHRCNFKYGYMRLFDGYYSTGTPQIVCSNCYIPNTYKKCQYFGAGSSAVFLACDGLDETPPYGTDVPANFFLGIDYLIQGTEQYGAEYGGWFYPGFAPEIYAIAGSVVLDGPLDAVELKLYRTTDTGAESCAWATTYPDAETGHWRFDYLPTNHQYYVSLIPPAGYKPELLGPYVPLQE